MAYATVDDLAGYVTTIPTTAVVLLDRASRDVDQALLTTVYDTDDVDVQDALRVATCEQAAGYIAAGLPAGAGGSVQSFSIGRLSVQRAAGAQTQTPAQMVGGLYRQAWQALQQAGLTGQAPWGY